MWIQKRQKSCVSWINVCDIAIIHSLLSTAENIKKFYCREVTSATITPIINMLEEHVVPWVKMGFGLLGEQGAESIHASFNSLKRQWRT